MVNEKVGPEGLQELFGGQMVSHRGKANPGRDSARSSEGAKQRCLGDAKAFPARQYIAGPVVFRTIEGGIRIVADSVTNCEVKLNGFFHGIAAASRHLMREAANDFVVAVYDRCRSKIFLHVRQVSKDRPEFVRPFAHCAHRDLFELQDHTLDLRRIDVIAGGNDHVFLAVHDKYTPFFVHVANISRVQPTVSFDRLVHRLGLAADRAPRKGNSLLVK